MKVIIKENEIELKYSFRSFMIYENITGKSFQPTNLTDILIFFYSTILGSSKNADLKFDEFMDLIDMHPELVTEFSEWLTNTSEINNEIENKAKDKFKDNVDQGGSKKPKKSKK